MELIMSTTYAHSSRNEAFLLRFSPSQRRMQSSSKEIMSKISSLCWPGDIQLLPAISNSNSNVSHIRLKKGVVAIREQDFRPQHPVTREEGGVEQSSPFRVSRNNLEDEQYACRGELTCVGCTVVIE